MPISYSYHNNKGILLIKILVIKIILTIIIILCVSFIYADQCRLLWPGPFAFSSIASDGFQVSGSGADSSSLSSAIT